MKINYKNTALDLLENPDNVYLSIPEPHKPMTEAEKKSFGYSLRGGFKDSKEMFNRNVRYISHPFFEAYERGKHKLADVFDKEEIEDSGTLIWQFGSFTFTNFYYLKTYIKDGEWCAEYLLIQISKHSKNDFKGLDVCITANKESEKTFIWADHYNSGHDHTWYFAFLVTILCFIRHVELETKVIQPEKKEFHIGTKYLNETKHKIEILDSTWFTTIVRSEGFGVRGHFRMQPFAGGNRKLIWISDFQKNGYTRKAKILTNANA